VTPYSTAHLVPLAIFLVGLVLVVRLGRRHRAAPDGPAVEAWGRAGAVALAAMAIPFQVVDVVTRFDIGTTLPFHLCDLAWVAAAVALWTRRPYWVALTCYWGIVLTTQAIVTPSVEDFPQVRYFAYWAHHVMTVWAAFYLAVGLGLAPRWREYRSTIATTLGWAVLAVAFNAVAGTNYGYLMRKPDTGSILDVLGPWPWYVAAEIVLVAAVWAGLTVLLRRLARLGQPVAGSVRQPVRS
jgi:hypothetical integral membrane protein (TIGR02206 family)